MDSEYFLSSVKKLTEQNLTLAEMIGIAEALKAKGDADHAAQIYSLWIKFNPSDPLLHAALFNYAVLLSDSGRVDEARQALESAVALNPDFYPAYINLGSALERLGRSAEAIQQWTELANRLPQITGSNLNYKLTAMKQIGRVLEANKLNPNAEHVLRQSLDLDPNQQDVLQHYVALRVAQCEWPVIQPWEGAPRKTFMKGTGPLSMAVYTDDPMLQLAAGWKYCRNFIGYPDHDYRARHDTPERKAKKGRLRIGYVSSDLRHHAVGFIMAEVFGLHDKEKVEVFAYYCGIPHEDDMKARIRSTIENWVDITNLTDEQAAQKIMDDGIDILVDVNGYTKDARTKVFALHPAPIIVNWLGFPGSMGSPYHHYIIADDYIIPKEHELYFSEKVLRLPCYQPNDRNRIIAETPTREAMGLPENVTIFCSFNGVQKISRFTFDRWLAVLKRVPDSVLWLLDGGDDTTKRLRSYAEANGVAGERIITAGKMPNAEHLARYRLADLFLDNLPYGAHVTASDALWLGVPILTLSGRGFASRVCGSLVTAAGLPELVCKTPDEWVDRAVELGSDPSKIAKLKAKLEANRESCVLFDTANLVRHLEKLYEGMWKDFVKGNLPRPDLANLEEYLDIGCEFDHDANEMMLQPDYQSFYREYFTRRHHYNPIRPDTRLWTEADIATAEGKTTKKTAAA